MKLFVALAITVVCMGTMIVALTTSARPQRDTALAGYCVYVQPGVGPGTITVCTPWE